MKPRADEIVVASEARESAARQKIAELTGETLSAEQRQGILGACQGAVRAKLKAPSTAKFSEDVTITADAKSGRWMVLSSLDAENAMGGMLRSNYVCSVEAFGKQYVPKSALIY